MSVLSDVKEYCGLEPDDDSFDTQLIVLINASFAEAYGAGFGDSAPANVDDTTEWPEMYQDPRLNVAKDFLLIRVRVLFDPPNNSTVLNAYNTFVDELKFRMLAAQHQINHGE